MEKLPLKVIVIKRREESKPGPHIAKGRENNIETSGSATRTWYRCIENFHLSAEELVSLLWTYCDHEELKHAAEDEKKATNLTKQIRRLLKIYCATTNWPSRYQGRRHRKHEGCSVGPHLEQINVEINRTFTWYLNVYPPEHGNSGQDCGHTHPNPWKWAHQ